MPFLAKWGVSYDKLKHDIKYGVGDVVTPSAPSKPSNGGGSSKTLGIGARVQPRWAANNKSRVWQLDKVAKVNGIWQGAEYLEAGGASNFTWLENGVPLALVDLTDKNGKKLSNQNNAAAGSYFKYNTYFKITKQGNNAKLGNMSFIVPESKGAGYGFWVLTKYLY